MGLDLSDENSGFGTGQKRKKWGWSEEAIFTASLRASTILRSQPYVEDVLGFHSI